MQTTTAYQFKKLALLAGLAGGVIALSACQPKPDEPTVGQRVDGAIATAEQSADKAKAEIKELAQEAKTAGGQTMDKVETGLGDAAITAGVNAELAKDAQLSALSINVDTREGHVALKGKAPSADARERATQLAAAVKGVRSVDNQLSVEPRS
jgi:hyperosmotically inducible periplasmic protein